MSNGFDPDGGFMSRFTKIVDTLILSILWLICSVPVFTAGAASGAFYYAYHKSIRQDGGHGGKVFFKAFRSNFKQATGIWLLVLVFTGLSLFTCYLLRKMRGIVPMADVFLTMGVVIIGFAVVWCIYLFPYQSRFENTMLTVMKNSAILAVANLPWSLLLLVMFVATVIAVVLNPAMCAPVAAVYIWLVNKILERIFRRLMTQEALDSEKELDGA